MLDVIIVNYRTAQLTIDCLRSLEPQVKNIGDVRVWVVENGSPDDSGQIIAHALRDNDWESWAHLEVSAKNLGFAGGNNLAIRKLLEGSRRSEFVLLLNPDTIVLPGALAALVQFMQLHPEVGIAGSQLLDQEGNISRSAFRFPTWRSELEQGVRLQIVSQLFRNSIVAPPPRPEPHQTDWVSGASMLVRREVFDAVGLLDEKYFMYYEELDFCLQARKKGVTCWYVPQSRVIHLEGKSSGIGNKERKRRPAYWFAARKYFFLKNYGWAQTLLANLCWAGGYALYRAGAVLRRLESPDPPCFWWDFISFNFFGKRDRC